jgi:hypothetical protein
VPDPSPFVKLKKYTSPGSDLILVEPIQVGRETLVFVIHKVINLFLNKEELPDHWKESIIVLAYKKGDKTGCSNYCGVSLVLTSYKILSNIHLSSLSPYIDEVIGDHHMVFHVTSTTDQIFCI